MAGYHEISQVGVGPWHSLAFMDKPMQSVFAVCFFCCRCDDRQMSQSDIESAAYAAWVGLVRSHR